MSTFLDVSVTFLKENPGAPQNRNVLKIVLIKPRLARIKSSLNDVISIQDIDFTNLIEGIAYTTKSHPLLSSIFYTVDYQEIAYRNIVMQLKANVVWGNHSHYIHENTVFPQYLALAEGETETDEPATETIIFPPKETPMQFIERISARLLHLTRRVSILRHEEPHLSERSRRVCLDLDDRSEYVHRYDHSINLVRLPVGWLQLQINSYLTRLKAHEEKVAAAEAANKKPPVFNEDRLQGKIETLLEKLEARLTEEMLLEHHETHDTDEWRNAHAARKIVLCNEDCSVGEEIADINSFHTANGVTNHVLAEKSFHDVSVKHWNEAKRTTFRKLVTERTVTLS